MDRVTQTAIMAAAIGAVVVVAGVTISYSSRLGKAGEPEPAVAVAPPRPAEHRPETAPSASDFGPDEIELELSTHGEPFYEAELSGREAAAQRTDAQDAEDRAADTENAQVAPEAENAPESEAPNSQTGTADSAEGTL